MPNPFYILAVAVGAWAGLLAPDWMVGKPELRSKPFTVGAGGGRVQGDKQARRMEFLGTWNVSAYDAPCEICCPGYGTHFADGSRVPLPRVGGTKREGAVCGSEARGVHDLWRGGGPDSPVGSREGSVRRYIRPVRILAAPRSIPFGARLWVSGVGECVVRDRGSAITEGRLDLFFSQEQGGHEAALQFGRQRLRVYQLKEE